jgi:HK97 family phage prohead protease
MAYELRDDKGIPIRKQGMPVLAMDNQKFSISELDEKEKSFIAVASTEHEDRDKDIVRQSGWKLTNFRKNPVMPWMHNYYGIPIARSLKTWVDETNKDNPRLLIKPKFDSEDDDSMKVFNKYKNGFLTSFSVGFRGIKFDYRDDEDKWWGGREFTEQELLEVSCVSVPANPHANTRLRYTGEQNPDNLIALGYPEIFAKTDSGLFYPVMDIAMFADPKEFEVAEGVIGVKAIPLDNAVEASGPVAYIFNEEYFDDKSANEWVEEHVGGTWKIKYFDMQNTNEDKFVLECFTAEDDIKRFETSIDLRSNEVSDKDVDSDNPIEDPVSDESKYDKDSDETKDLDSENVEGDSNQEASEDKSDTEDNVEGDSKNLNNNDVEALNQEILLIKEQFNTIKQLLDELPKQITVAILDNISNNTQQLNESDDDSQLKTSKDDELIELDQSLILPDVNDKTNDDNCIEIDESLLKESTSDTQKVVKKTLVDTLRTKLQEVLNNASGTID